MANPTKYAESVLGVHDTYQKAEKAHAELVAAQESLGIAQQAIRHLHELLAEREQEVAAEQRAANSDMSATAFRDFVKGALQTDDQMQDLRLKVASKQGERDEADSRIESARYRLKIEVARMNELGGLLNFYAAAKYATNATTQNRQGHENG